MKLNLVSKLELFFIPFEYNYFQTNVQSQDPSNSVESDTTTTVGDFFDLPKPFKDANNPIRAISVSGIMEFCEELLYRFGANIGGRRRGGRRKNRGNRGNGDNRENARGNDGRRQRYMTPPEDK